MQRRDVEPVAHFVQNAGQIQSRADAADGAGENVVEHERRDGYLGERSAHGFVDDLVHAAADEHAAALDIDRPYRVGEKHDGQDEPGSRLADLRFGDAARIIGGGGEIAQDDGRRSPERDERQHDRGSNHDFRPRGSTRRQPRSLTRCHIEFLPRGLAGWGSHVSGSDPAISSPLSRAPLDSARLDSAPLDCTHHWR